MPNYAYIAVDKKGKEKKATIESENPDKAVEQIHQMGMLPVELSEVGTLGAEIKVNINRKVKTKELGLFCRQFVSMVSAGVTIIDALQMLADQMEHKTLRDALQGCCGEVKKGRPLSEAMGHYPKVFPEMMVNMAEAGETSGNIENAFARMAVQFEKSAKLSGLLLKSMVYPIVLMVVAIVILIVMVVYVIPGYAKTFAENGMELPGITKAMMSMSRVIQGYWYIFVLCIVAGILLLIRFRRSEMGIQFFSKLAIRLPLFGKLNIKTYASQFSRTLSTLVHAGIPLIDGLEAVSKTMKNALFREHLAEAAEEVSKGVLLSEELKREKLFPPMVPHMVAIGEETGDLEGMLDKLADYYDQEVEVTTQTVMAAMEPMIIIVMAVIVVLLIASIFAPMLSMYDQIGNM